MKDSGAVVANQYDESMPLDLIRLKHFVAVARERSFHRAADSLGITQPPVSRAIMSLERDFGCEFFIRTSKRVELTAAGWVLLGQAISILEHVETAERAIRNAVVKKPMKTKSRRKSAKAGMRWNAKKG